MYILILVYKSKMASRRSSGRYFIHVLSWQGHTNDCFFNVTSYEFLMPSNSIKEDVQKIFRACFIYTED